MTLIFHISLNHLISVKFHDKSAFFFMMVVSVQNIIYCSSEHGSLTAVSRNFCVRCVKVLAGGLG